LKASVGRLESRVFSEWGGALLLSFVFGFVVRLIPEVLLSPYPIGFDPIWYAWRIKSGVVWYHWSQFFSTWLLYGILVPLCNATQVNLFSLLKFVAALLFGFVVCGMYYFATKGLGWSVKKATVASVLFSLQAAALFISANLYRNMLGLGILLFTLPLLKDELRSKRQFIALTLMSVLVVLGHEVASAILFAVMLGFLVIRSLGRRELDVKMRLLAVIPAFVLFVVSFWFLVSPQLYQVDANGIVLNEPGGNYQGALYFFSNYLGTGEIGRQFAVYSGLAWQIFSFFGILYILMLPLVLVGFFRNAILNSWTVFTLVGSFGAVVVPVLAPSVWSRWMLMLVFPFTFYAVNGVAKVLRLSSQDMGLNVKWARWMNLQKRAVTLIVIISVASGLVFTLWAMPVQASVVPLVDYADTVKAVSWVDSQMGDNSVLLAHFAFNYWSRLCLDERHVRIYFKDDIEGALSLAIQRGFSDVYFVWWKERVSWFNLAVPEGFSSVFSSGRICVLRYSV
jgi:hypothetical protein